MSGTGAPTLIVPKADHLSIAIVASSWHTGVMDGLIAGAQRAMAESGATSKLVRVPGSFELPVAAARLIKVHDAVVALGVVIRGGTPHFEYVCAGTTQGLMDVSTRSGKPVGFGLLTCDNEDQALDRAGLPGSREDKGYEAAIAAITTCIALGEQL
jgi:6,7-dimethyl-8-ribityllumazine synthase